MIYHIVIGDLAAIPLKEAIAAEHAMEGEVVVMKDVLSVGPLQKSEGQKFSELRTVFWQEVVVSDRNSLQVDDLERLLEVSLELSRNEAARVWLWLAPLPADMCTYLWTLKYLGKYTGQFFVINIAGLPFLDVNGKVYYPHSIAEILPRELIKAKRLARPVTLSEMETDGEEWARLVGENAGIRTHEGGKKIMSRGENFYDQQLISFCLHQYQKASKIVGQTIARYNIPTGDLYLGWRLRRMADAGRLELQGDTAKSLKDFDIKLPGDGTNAQISLAI
jgi:hypothetical protein